MKAIQTILTFSNEEIDFCIEKIDKRLTLEEKKVIYNSYVKNKLASLTKTFHPFADLIKIYEEVIEYDLYKIFIFKLTKDRYKYNIRSYIEWMDNIPEDLKDILNATLLAERLCEK